jgi:hypothetical protein
MRVDCREAAAGKYPSTLCARKRHSIHNFSVRKNETGKTLTINPCFASMDYFSIQLPCTNFDGMIPFRFGKQIWGFLFSFFFLIYAISPLTYTLSKTETIQCCSSAQGAFSDRPLFSVFLMEVILEAFSPSGNRLQGTESDTILIRKKRALLPETVEEKLISSESIAVTHIENFPLPQLRYDWLKKNISSAGTAKGFRLQYAGHSPPNS